MWEWHIMTAWKTVALNSKTQAPPSEFLSSVVGSARLPLPHQGAGRWFTPPQYSSNRYKESNSKSQGELLWGHKLKRNLKSRWWAGLEARRVPRSAEPGLISHGWRLTRMFSQRRCAGSERAGSWNGTIYGKLGIWKSCLLSEMRVSRAPNKLGEQRGCFQPHGVQMKTRQAKEIERGWPPLCPCECSQFMLFIVQSELQKSPYCMTASIQI